MHWLNQHVVPTSDGSRYIYRCTRDDCSWTSPPLRAIISDEAVQRNLHPEHRVQLADEER